MSDMEPELAEIVAEGQRLGGPTVTWRVQQNRQGACVVIALESEDALGARRLTDGLYAFCDARGYRRRFLVVRSTVPAFRDRPLHRGAGPHMGHANE